MDANDSVEINLSNVFSNDALEKAHQTAEIMKILMNLKTDEISTNAVRINEILNNFDNESDIEHFLFQVLFAVRYRPLSIELLSSLFIEICASFDDEMKVNEIRRNFLDSFIFRFDFQNSAHLCFLHHLNRSGFIETRLIIDSLEIFLSQMIIQNESPLLVYSWFAKEVDQTDAELEEKLRKKYRKMKNRNSLSKAIESFFSKLPEMRRNDWALYDRYRTEGFNENELYQIIKNDDIESFQKVSCQHGFDINQMIPDSTFDRVLFLKDGPRPIHVASFFGSVKVFKFLILNGAELSLRDNASNYVTYFAVAGGNAEVIRILEQNEWNFHNTPRFAVLFHRMEIFDWLNSSKYSGDQNEINVLLFAARSNNIESILQCIEFGCDVNVTNRNKETPIFQAVKSRSLDSLELLMSHKSVNLNAVDNENCNLLHIAARKNFFEGTKLIISANKIDINGKDNYGSTPLTIAIENGHFKMAKTLLENDKIDPNSKVKDGGPLHICLQCNNVAFLKELLDTKKFDVNLTNQSSFTPLHLAAIKNLPGAISVLCNEQNVNVNIVDQAGQTPLAMSIESGDIESVKAFLNSGRVFDMDSKNREGLTYLEIAERTGNTEIVSMIKNFINK